MSAETLRNVVALEQVANGHKPARTPAGLGPYEVTLDEKNRLVLPDMPATDDVAGLCGWLTAVFNLDRRHPITGGVRQGLHGPEGHAVLHRRDARRSGSSRSRRSTTRRS